MSKIHNFVVVLGCLAGGIGLVVTGGVISNEAMLAAGVGLLGVVLGAVGLDKPQSL